MRQHHAQKPFQSVMITRSPVQRLVSISRSLLFHSEEIKTLKGRWTTSVSSVSRLRRFVLYRKEKRLGGKSRLIPLSNPIFKICKNNMAYYVKAKLAYQAEATCDPNLLEVTKRILQGRAEIRNFSLSVEKYFTRSLCSHVKRKFISPRDRVLFYLLYKHQWNTKSHRKARFLDVTLATRIFSRVKITCYRCEWRYHVFPLKLTWYFIGVQIIILFYIFSYRSAIRWL